MLLTTDPELFTVQESKMMGIWPPSDIVSHGLLPYIKRLRVDKVSILEVGVHKGENAIQMLSNDERERIGMIYGIFYGDKKIKEILQKNTANESRFSMDVPNEDFDVVIINSECKNLTGKMEKYYNKVKSNGIFCGNNHDKKHVKEALVDFRRRCKIGTPILVSNGSFFWYKR